MTLSGETAVWEGRAPWGSGLEPALCAVAKPPTGASPSWVWKTGGLSLGQPQLLEADGGRNAERGEPPILVCSPPTNRLSPEVHALRTDLRDMLTCCPGDRACSWSPTKCIVYLAKKKKKRGKQPCF